MTLKNLLFAGLVMLSMNVAAQTVNMKAKAQPLPHTWSVGTCAGRLNEGLRARWNEQLAEVHNTCGFQYLRMHGMFDDDNFVCFQDKKGRITYNWQYIDEVYDRIIDLGMKPFVELSFFPGCIAAENTKKQM